MARVVSGLDGEIVPLRTDDPFLTEVHRHKCRP